jgi:hypothetical protein
VPRSDGWGESVPQTFSATNGYNLDQCERFPCSEYQPRRLSPPKITTSVADMNAHKTPGSQDG